MNASIEIQNGIKNLSNQPEIKKYFNNSGTPYQSVDEAFAQIPVNLRHLGLTVNVLGDEYWWKSDTSNSGLILKPSAGADGAQGTDGANGATWYSGSTVPTSGTGANNDYYLRTTNGDVYLKSLGVWGVITNIKGATGATGSTGATGKGISSIARTSGTGAAGTTDTYTITFSDSTTTTFTVVNGSNGSTGAAGATGAAGKGISSIARTSGTGAAGTTDTYTITFTDSTTTTFNVVNGANGSIGATGAAGANAPQVQIQYSVDGSTNWHSTPVDADMYAQFSVDGGNNWGSAIKFQGAGAGSSTLTSDIQVNLTGGRTFGKYVTGSTIPAVGKTLEQVIRDAALESINPSASVSASGSIAYNTTTGTITVSMSSTCNNPSPATISSYVLSYKRGSGSWVQLYSGVVKASHSHVVDSLLATDNTSSFTYQLVVTDSTGASNTATSNTITPAGYSAPTCTIAVSGTRELGNISTTLSGSVSQTAQNGVSITTRTLQYSLNNSTWVDIAAGTLTNTINYTHNDAALVNSTIIYYRLVVVCSTPTGNQTANLALGSISFVYKSVFGYDTSATPTLATILAMGNSVLTNAKAKTITATAPASNYTYYAYCAAAGDLTSIIMDGVTPVLGSFTKMTDVTGVNSYGATVTYRIYKSNAPAAFTSNSLVIS